MGQHFAETFCDQDVKSTAEEQGGLIKYVSSKAWFETCGYIPMLV